MGVGVGVVVQGRLSHGTVGSVRQRQAGTARKVVGTPGRQVNDEVGSPLRELVYLVDLVLPRVRHNQTEEQMCAL